MMIKEIEEVLSDCRNCYLPKNTDSFEKLPSEDIKNGDTLAWYFKEDLKLAKEENYPIREIIVYSGIVMATPDTEYNGRLEPEDCIIVMDNYPCENAILLLHGLL